ncbi:MAG: recombinase family protein [Oscillospiraceae bacterium]|nr:recombinase family protein [Oscillospiraceae bacterium]
MLPFPLCDYNFILGIAPLCWGFLFVRNSSFPYCSRSFIIPLVRTTNKMMEHLFTSNPNFNYPEAKLKMKQLTSYNRVAGYLNKIFDLEVSRLARSTQQLCEIINTISEKKLRLVIVGSITLDCRNGQPDPMSEAFLQIAGVFSQLELSMIRARVRSGMANARAKGSRIGRPQLTTDNIPSNFLRHYPAYRSGQLNVSELARVCGISRTTAYRYLEMLEG